jgi:hypothetical protein
MMFMPVFCMSSLSIVPTQRALPPLHALSLPASLNMLLNREKAAAAAYARAGDAATEVITHLHFYHLHMFITQTYFQKN